jgi:glutathione S-transferase
MTLKIHGYPGAISTQRVINICHELGLEFSFILVDFKTSAQKSSEYLALQPFGKVPVLEDNGFFVYESRAICKYLAVKNSGEQKKLIPDQKEVQKYALFEQVSPMNLTKIHRKKAKSARGKVD